MANQGPLTALYTAFLTNPKKEVLHAQAGLHYISSTGNSFQTSAAIIGHLTREALLYEKKEQKVLSAVESSDAVVVEVSTTIEFKNGGGVLLPGLDDNFVADQTVYLPMVHIVQFEDHVIKQIRVYWEQGSVLKQLGVIGKTGKNWPILPGDEQLKLVKSSIGAVVANGNSGTTESASSTRPSSKGSNQSGRESIQLFAPREVGSEEAFKPAVIAPRAGMKPPSRQLHEIVGEEDDLPIVAQTPKAGVKNAPRRTFFLGQDIDEADSTPDRKYLTHPQKFKHFDLNAESDDVDTPKVIAPKRQSVYGKPGSSWDFSDFATPDKKPGKVNTRDARTFSWSDDEDTSPVKAPPKKPVPRKDAETHFDIVDETPKKDSKPTKQPYVRKDNETHFTLADDSPAHSAVKSSQLPAARQAVLKGMDANWNNNFSPLGEPKPVNNHSGINVGGDGMGGKKGSDRIWGFQDESPAARTNGKGINIGGNGMGGRSGTERSWAFEGDEAPVETAKPVAPKGRGINIAGNGMGARKGTDLHWGFGDDDEEEEEKPAPIKKENAPIPQKTSYRPVRKQSEVTSDFWEF
ncbi:hypothetical protein ABW19_dt0210267 [Dactylella cylindrospora]|nr:hypothetical protein ABW19_dt0210267 [Dactylella cylindrospora]